MGTRMKRDRARPLIAAGLLALLAVAFMLKACAPDRPNGNTQEDKNVAPSAVNAPLFDPDSAFGFVAKQVSFGPRVPGSKAHTACGDWLVATFKRFGAQVIEQKATVTAYNGQPVPLRNIIASWQPEKKERVLLMAHWDSRPFADRDIERQSEPIDGANDGGSGVAVWLELARHLADRSPAVGVDIFLTDVEDMGQPHEAMGGMDENESMRTWCLGSQYWVKNPHVPGYTARYGVLLDMVGSVDARFPREGLSMRFAPQVVGRIWKAAAAAGHGDRFLSDTRNYVGIDDHLIVNEGTGIPVADIIAWDMGTGAFPSTWHTHKDSLDAIDRSSLEAVGATMMQVIWGER